MKRLSRKPSETEISRRRELKTPMRSSTLLKMATTKEEVNVKNTKFNMNRTLLKDKSKSPSSKQSKILLLPKLKWSLPSSKKTMSSDDYTH